MTKTRLSLACVLVLSLAPSLFAQSQSDSGVAIRPFLMITGQQFVARETFDAVFGRSVQPFWGGGAQLTFDGSWFVDVTLSQFKETGERAFRLDDETFHVGIPLKATVTPLEVSAGYRFLGRPGQSRGLIPYVGAGVGTYKLTETSDFAEDDDVNERHAGFLAIGGAEFRLRSRVSAAVDVAYTRIPGLLGRGGISKEVGENDLGGVSARFRVLVGPLFGR